MTAMATRPLRHLLHLPLLHPQQVYPLLHLPQLPRKHPQQFHLLRMLLMLLMLLLTQVVCTFFSFIPNDSAFIEMNSSATFFYQNGVAGACGTVHSDYDMIAAIGQSRFKFYTSAMPTTDN